jgi:hypothetical protein
MDEQPARPGTQSPAFASADLKLPDTSTQLPIRDEL